MKGAAEEPAQEETVVLSFPAITQLVVLARFAAATVAARAGFNVEEIEDLRLAVDELCASVGPFVPDQCVRVELHRVGSSVRVQCTCEPRHGSGSPGSSSRGAQWSPGDLSIQLLSALVDEHGFDERNGCVIGWLEKQPGLAS